MGPEISICISNAECQLDGLSSSNNLILYLSNMGGKELCSFGDVFRMKCCGFEAKILLAWLYSTCVITGEISVPSVVICSILQTLKATPPMDGLGVNIYGSFPTVFIEHPLHPSLFMYRTTVSRRSMSQKENHDEFDDAFYDKMVQGITTEDAKEEFVISKLNANEDICLCCPDQLMEKETGEKDLASRPEETKEVQMQCAVLDSDEVKQVNDEGVQEDGKKEEHEDVAALRSTVDFLVNFCSTYNICSFYVQGKCKRGACCCVRHLTVGPCPIPGCLDTLNAAGLAHLGYHINDLRRKASKVVGFEEAKEIVNKRFKPLRDAAKSIEERTCWFIPPEAANDESSIASLLSGITGIKDFFLVEEAEHLVIEFSSQDEAAEALEAIQLKGFTPKKKQKSRRRA
jgi:hypothetical protein